MFRKLKIAHIILLGFSVPMLVVLAYGTLVTRNISAIGKEAYETTGIYQPAQNCLGDLRISIARTRAAQLLHLVLGPSSAQQEQANKIATYEAAARHAIQTYNGLPDEGTAEEAKAWKELVPLYDRYVNSYKQFLQLSASGKHAEAVAFDKDIILPIYFDMLRNAELVHSENGKGAAKNSANLQAVISSTKTLSIVCIVVALLVTALGAFYTARIIARPVADLTEAAIIVAGGDYSDHIKQEHLYVGELVPLLEAIRTMIRAIKTSMQDAAAKADMATSEAQQAQVALGEAEKAKASAESKTVAIAQAVVELRKVMDQLEHSSQSLRNQVDAASNGAGVQSQRVAETATAMEQMNATVLEVAKNAEEASSEADGARTHAEEGAHIVDSVVRDMGDTASSAQKLKTDMAELEQQAVSIGRIMNVISDIADQTNLLALNAAIEAARAGEAGRGFAVVADEVRKLAEKTMQATSEVGQAIRGIQKGTEVSTQAVDDMVQQIEIVAGKARESGVALGQIVESVRAASAQVASIATASSEQSAASDEITHAIDGINTISVETAQIMGDSAAAVHALAEQTVQLGQLITQLESQAR